MDYYKITFPFKTNIPMLVQPNLVTGENKNLDFFILKNRHNRLELWYKSHPINLVVKKFKNYHHPNLWNDENIVILDKLKEEKINKMTNDNLNKLGLFRIEEDFSKSKSDIDSVNINGETIRTVKLNKIVQYLIENDDRIPKVFDDNYTFFNEIDRDFTRVVGIVVKVKSKTNRDNANDIKIKELDTLGENFTDSTHTIIIFMNGYNSEIIINKLVMNFSYSKYEFIDPQLRFNIQRRPMFKIEFRGFSKLKDLPVISKKIRIDTNGLINFDLLTEREKIILKIIYALNTGLITDNAEHITVVENKMRTSREGAYYRFISNILINKRESAIRMADKNTSKFEVNNSEKSLNEFIFNNKKFSDIMITHNKTNNKIYAHKLLLYVSNSAFMRSFFDSSQFSDSAKESLNIDCEYYDTFIILLKSIYQMNDTFIEYINELIEAIIEFTQNNKANFYLDWNKLDKYSEYSDKIAKLQDLYKTIKYYQLKAHEDYINNLILKNITVDKLLIDLGQINPDIAIIPSFLSFKEVTLLFIIFTSSFCVSSSNVSFLFKASQILLSINLGS